MGGDAQRAWIHEDIDCRTTSPLADFSNTVDAVPGRECVGKREDYVEKDGLRVGRDEVCEVSGEGTFLGGPVGETFSKYEIIDENFGHVNVLWDVL